MYHSCPDSFLHLNSSLTYSKTSFEAHTTYLIFYEVSILLLFVNSVNSVASYLLIESYLCPELGRIVNNTSPYKCVPYKLWQPAY